ncbi:MAG: sigma-70 family RNA polymerase sigma factor, partial [Planctomycetota bacterium]
HLRRMALFRMDQRLVGRVDADDVLQEAYLSASQRLRHFAEEFAAGSHTPRDAEGRSVRVNVWLRLIVAQTLIDIHRRHLGAQKRNAGREVGLHAGVSPAATSLSLVRGLMGRLTTPSQAAMRAELGEQLQCALASMSEIDQEVIALRHFEELSNAEVAHVLAIEAKAASIRYVRAVRRLKQVLAGFPGFDELASLV